MIEDEPGYSGQIDYHYCIAGVYYAVGLEKRCTDIEADDSITHDPHYWDLPYTNGGHERVFCVGDYRNLANTPQLWLGEVLLWHA